MTNLATTTSRDYRDGDLTAMLGLAQELWCEDTALIECTFGQIAFWSAQLLHDDWTARLWFEAETLVAWGWLTNGVELEWEVRPTYRELLDEILDWARPSEVLVRSHHAEAIERLRAHGLEHDPDAPWMRSNVRSLDELEEPHLPEGYRLATMADYDGFESRSAAHRTAFAPSRFRDDVYAKVRETWPYRADLDCVVVAPDGSVASYALAWLDEQNAVGEFEPVGTHEAHRRRGLGRAVNLFALRRLRDEGATTALVGCRGDAGYPIPCKLYESVGFRELARSLAFTRGRA
jgi:GNAT superfamily N-acetyltransferase